MAQIWAKDKSGTFYIIENWGERWKDTEAPGPYKPETSKYFLPSLAFAVIYWDLQAFSSTSRPSQLNFTSDLFLRVEKHCATSDTYWNMSAPQVLTRSGFGPQFSSSCDNSHIKINWEVLQEVPGSHSPHSYVLQAAFNHISLHLFAVFRLRPRKASGRFLLSVSYKDHKG